MVSSSLGISDEELLEALARIRQECADDGEYQEIRRQLPDEWPV